MDAINVFESQPWQRDKGKKIYLIEPLRAIHLKKEMRTRKKIEAIIMRQNSNVNCRITATSKQMKKNQ